MTLTSELGYKPSSSNASHLTPQKDSPQYPLERRLGMPQSRSEVVEERQIFAFTRNQSMVIQLGILFQCLLVLTSVNIFFLK